MRRVHALLRVLLLISQTAVTHAQTPASPQPSSASEPQLLTLAQAEAIAVANQPRILAARLRALSSARRVLEARAGLLPTIAFNATGATVADTGTATAAGALTTSSISDRFAYGGNLVQLITDFGRTSALIASQRSLADAHRIAPREEHRPQRELALRRSLRAQRQTRR